MPTYNVRMTVRFPAHVNLTLEAQNEAHARAEAEYRVKKRGYVPTKATVDSVSLLSLKGRDILWFEDAVQNLHEHALKCLEEGNSNLAQSYRADAEDLRQVLAYYSNGDYREAYRRAYKLDTFVRDCIPDCCWDRMSEEDRRGQR